MTNEPLIAYIARRYRLSLEHARVIATLNFGGIMTRHRLPNRRHSIAFNFECEGHQYRATASRFPDGRLAELFLDSGKINTPLQSNAETAAMLVPLLLRHGVASDTIRRSVSGPIATALDLAVMP